MTTTARTLQPLTDDELSAALERFSNPAWLDPDDAVTHEADQARLRQELGPLQAEDYARAEIALRDRWISTRAGFDAILWETARHRRVAELVRPSRAA